MRLRLLALALALATAATTAHAQAVPGMTAEQCGAGKTPIMVLGSYHMANPGHDTVNMHADSVSTPKRQRELNELLDRLARFRPTKVAIESTREGTRPARYSAYLAGTYQLTENEIDQIGFALARRMGIKQISPVDFDMWMNGLQPTEQHTPKTNPKPVANAAANAKPVASPEEDSDFTKQIKAVVKDDEERLKNGTIADYLAYLNSPERARLNYQWDVESNLDPGDGYAMYEKTDLATGWYKRNLRIVTNVIDITEPGDRVFVLFGAGHKKILSDLFAENPKYCLVDTVKYLKGGF
jgi:hypothetical protein